MSPLRPAGVWRDVVLRVCLVSSQLTAAPIVGVPSTRLPRRAQKPSFIPSGHQARMLRAPARD